MTKRNTSIQINGKRYDALSGAAMEFESTPVKVTKSRKSIDGLVASQAVIASQVVKTTPVLVKAKPKTKLASQRVVARASAQHAPLKRATPSRTLMRHAVSKPKTSLKSRAKVQPASYAVSGKVVVMPKVPLHSVNQHRAQRATNYQLSPQVSHFARNLKHDVYQAAQAIDEALVIPDYSMPTIAVQPTASAATTDIFEKALQRATGHEEPAPVLTPSKRGRAARSLKRRMISFSAGAVAVLAIVGFFGYNGQQKVEYKVASNRAGFSISVPSYQPTGFSVSSMQSSADAFNLRYVNPNAAVGASDSFSVIEKPTSWDSVTLLQRLTESQDAGAYTSLDAAGRTVYIYGSNQAAWVHKGVLYQVLGNGALSTGDFTQLAASM